MGNRSLPLGKFHALATSGIAGGASAVLLKKFPVIVHLPPAVRSLFRRRAGRGARAKLSEGVFAVLGDSYAGFPGKSVTKIPQISVPNLNINLFESSWGSGGFLQEAPRRSPAPYLNCNTVTRNVAQKCRISAEG